MQVTPLQKDEIKREPTSEELSCTLKALPKEKAPGLDGLTVEVLKACWSFLLKESLAMIHNF